MEKRKVTLVMDDLTLGDLEAFEKATGLSLMDELTPKPVIDPNTKLPIKDPDSDKGRPLMRAKINATTHLGLVYLGLLREDPNTSIDAVRKMRLGTIDFDLRAEADDVAPLDPSSETNEES